MDFRPFDPQLDYPIGELMTRLDNPENAWTAAELRASHLRRPADAIGAGWIGAEAGEPAVWIDIYEPWWSRAPGRFSLEVIGPADMPDDRFGEALDFARAKLAEMGATEIWTWTRSALPARVAAIEARGYKVSERYPISKLDLTTFDFAAWQPAVDAATAQGLRVRTLEEVFADPPDGDWIRRFYDMFCDIDRTTPGEDLMSESWEDFTRRIESPDVWPRPSSYVGFVGEEIVAYTSLHPRQAIPTQCEIGFTGVRSSHRRLGFAKAMKLTAMRRARERGAEAITTGNRDDNPLLGFNLALGFRVIYESMQFRQNVTS